MAAVINLGIPEDMSLQDTFKKKSFNETKAEALKVAPLRMPPTLDDLRFVMDQSRKQTGRPSALSWVTDTDTYVLTATHSAGINEPTWILHVGSETISAIAWRYTSGDVELVHSFLEQVQPPEMANAVIPEFLRPGYASEDKEHDYPLPPLPKEFSDKFEIIDRLGFGGMGVIYKARNKENGDFVALKVLHGHLMAEKENRMRFMKEAEACLNLKHRNLINVLEFNVSKQNQPFIMMEYLEGVALKDVIKEAGSLEIPRFVNLFLQICDGLRFAHEKGVVHRDVKPSNIMVLRSTEGLETAKVLDFGIAKMLEETDQKNHTPTGNVLGSPAYISPEQAAGTSPDPRFDVYSLGCVMYEALAGHPPFVHDSSIKVLMMQLGDPPPPLSAVCPEGAVPPKLEAIIMRCLEKNPEKRYPSAADLGADLFLFATSRNRGQQSSELDAAAERKPGVAQAAATPGLSGLARAKNMIVVRLRRCRSPGELDGVWEGLSMAMKIQSREMPVGILLDSESVILVMRPDMFVSRLNLDAQTSKRIATMQAMLQQLVKGGALVFASERWVKRGGDESKQVMPGVIVINDDEICDLIIERSGSLVDY